MIQKKICLLGAFSVGKTSLIRQFVSSIFDEKYLTTIGVKVDKKELQIDGQDILLMIWDLAGEDDYNTLQTNYLRGASGYILVVDGTRSKSLDSALNLHDTVQSTLGEIPCVVALNKVDIEDQWTITADTLEALEENFQVVRTSAKTGENVEMLFLELTRKML